jgi:hypothetical protein
MSWHSIPTFFLLLLFLRFLLFSCMCEMWQAKDALTKFDYYEMQQKFETIFHSQYMQCYIF